jgi:hypothetical protein
MLTINDTFDDILGLPLNGQTKLVLNPCPTIPSWNKDLHKVLSKKYPVCEERYRKWYESKQNWSVGNAQLVKVHSHFWVLNFLWDLGNESNDLLDSILMPKIMKHLQDNPGMSVHYLDNLQMSDFIKIEERFEKAFFHFQDLSFTLTAHYLPF